MLFLFWGFVVVMTLVVIAIVAVPFRKIKSVPGKPGILLAVIAPLIAVGMYAHLGSPDALTVSADQTFGGNHTQPSRPVASVGSLVDGLKERLRREPNDAGGWLLLARSYRHLGQHEDALLAYERARSLGKIDVEFDKLRSSGGLALQEAMPDSGPALRGRVSLSSEAATRIKPDDTVFIFAKASPDKRMPVVALRKPAADLPIDFVLTDAQAMVAGTHLADFEELVVVAQVSRSGLASDTVAGLVAWSDPVSPIGGGDIQLLIATDPPTEDRGNE